MGEHLLSVSSPFKLKYDVLPHNFPKPYKFNMYHCIYAESSNYLHVDFRLDSVQETDNIHLCKEQS